MSILIAIDPGASGGICILRDGELTVHNACDTPAETRDILEQAQRDSGGSTFDASNGPALRCVMEKVGGYVGGGGQPGSAMFTFGCGYGVYIGILTTLRIPFELVSPQSWQKGLSLGSKGLQRANITKMMTPEEKRTEKRRVSVINTKLKSDWKRKLKEVASQLYPHVKTTLKTCDALLILEWARRRERMESAQPAQKELIA